LYFKIVHVIVTVLQQPLTIMDRKMSSDNHADIADRLLRFSPSLFDE